MKMAQEHLVKGGCLCVSPNLSRSQNKVLESLEIIPQHGEPITTANYDNVRRYLIKVTLAGFDNTLHH